LLCNGLDDVALDDDVELLLRLGVRDERREAHAADSHHTPDHDHARKTPSAR
jgi:hypothetical protein